MFCHIAQNWRAKPPVSRIAATTTTTGLTVRWKLDEKTDAKDIKVTDAGMATLNIARDLWHPARNDTINLRLPGRSGKS